MRTMTWVAIGWSLSAGLAMASDSVPEVTSAASNREAVAVTIYNDNLALVKERRRVELPAGLARFSLRDVTAELRPETALLRAIAGQPITLVEQNFDFDVLTPQKLLEKYVGKEVTVIRSHPTTGEERRETAIVLSDHMGAVLKFPDRIETGVPGRLAFDNVPPNLRDRPTLSVLLESGGGSQSVELSYLTGGMTWKADYVANLATDGKSVDLNGWVTLTNKSGAGFDDATLQLVAGTVNRARPPGAQHREVGAVMGAVLGAALPREEALMDYHLYSFERPTGIAHNQTKQLALLSASAVPVGREYLLAGSDWYYRDRRDAVGQKQKPSVFLEFDNRGGALGKPLPGGVVRVYAKDSKGAAQFVGEDRIEHTAKNEKVRLWLGEAFDITAERTQLAFNKLADKLTESGWRIELRNAKDEAVNVKVQEPIPGDWEIVQESQRHTKESARVASWQISVPAGGSAVLEYTARVKW